MSPLWRDEVGAYLSPHRLCLVRMKRGVRPQPQADFELRLEAARGDAWAAPLETLAAKLGEEPWSGTPIRIVIGDHWARYAIVPWVAALSSTEERLVHGRQLLASAYGEAVASWDVRISEAPPGATRVACAVPADLVAGIRAICNTHGASLLSLQPQLIAAHEAWRHCLPPSNAWFVSIEQGSMAAARLGRNGWDRAHVVRIGAEWLRELRRLQTFSRLASYSPGEGRVYVDAPHAWREVASGTAAAPSDSGGLEWLEEPAGPLTTLQRLGRARRMAA
ncbi:MAG TPA: hypothetical protein VGH61_03945 [Steroidobacteraceae bacterium]